MNEIKEDEKMKRKKEKGILIDFCATKNPVSLTPIDTHFKGFSVQISSWLWFLRWQDNAGYKNYRPTFPLLNTVFLIRNYKTKGEDRPHFDNSYWSLISIGTYIVVEFFWNMELKSVCVEKGVGESVVIANTFWFRPIRSW